MQNLKENLKLYLLVFLIGINFFIWYAIFSENRKDLTVAFLDVGQGDAIFIESVDGKQVLIDGGSNAQVLRQLGQVMPFYDRSIDMVVLTHPDQDHIGGLPAVLETYKVDYVLESGVSSDSEVYKEFENIIEEKQIRKILARQGMNIPLCNLTGALLREDCDSYLEVLFPIGDVSDFETNTSSVILKLTNGENSFLFTGDSPQSIEKYLAGSLGDYLDVDVLKLGHHGSKTSSSDIFLGFTSPEYSVASVGLNNSYNHPNQEVIDLLNKFEIPLLRTDELGNIIFESDGQDLEIKNLGW